ncbi:uncharacterized protein J5F26_016312 isoform 1-T5 [Ciconia maguari]
MATAMAAAPPRPQRRPAHSAGRAPALKGPARLLQALPPAGGRAGSGPQGVPSGGALSGAAASPCWGAPLGTCGERSPSPAWGGVPRRCDPAVAASAPSFGEFDLFASSVGFSIVFKMWTPDLCAVSNIHPIRATYKVTASHWTLMVSCFSDRVSSDENDPEDHL